MANSFRFDPNLCTGCAACRLACTIENGLPFGRSWRRIETFNPMHVPGIPLYHLSLACNHCDEPACMHACPALAYRRDEVTGAVLLEATRCIGCKYCAWACPYDAPVFDPRDGVMTKCTFCNDRIREGSEPACVALCPTGALGFGNLERGAATQAVPGFPHDRLGPRIRIEPLRRERPPAPDATVTAAPIGIERISPRAGGISLRTEWSLMLFTALLAALVALVATAAWTGLRIPALGLVTGAALTIALASAHLGRKLRAWRALLNLRRSWLSREIASVSSFLGVAALYTAFAPDDRGVGVLAGLLGFLALFCADRVYSVLGRAQPIHLHSAGLFSSGLFLTGVFAHVAWLAGAVGVVKLISYIRRKRDRRIDGVPWRPGVSILRIAFGFLLPLALWTTTSDGLSSIAIAAALIGEWIDRGEFYDEIDRVSPSRTLDRALREAVGGERFFDTSRTHRYDAGNLAPSRKKVAGN